MRAEAKATSADLHEVEVEPKPLNLILYCICVNTDTDTGIAMDRQDGSIFFCHVPGIASCLLHIPSLQE